MLNLPQAWAPAPGYLLNHSAGIPPITLKAHLEESLLGPWTTGNDQVWPQWLAGVDAFRRALAQVIRHEPGMVCPQPNVSAAVSQVLGAVPRNKARGKLLIAERAFPSLGFVFSIARRSGFEPVMVPRSENTLELATWDRYLDSQVHAVLLTHVHSNTSECHDIAALAGMARKRGIVSIVDVAQSIGIRPIDANAWNADFIAGSCLKWLCGGSGAGFLWVNPERLEQCQPRDVGWFSHADPFEFDINHFEYAPDALRFWGGTPSVAPCLTAAHSIESLLSVGLDSIQDHNRELSEKLCAAVAPEFQVSPIDPAHRGGSVVLNFGDRQSNFENSLSNANIHFDARNEGVRLSPHLYNTQQDIDNIIGSFPA
ncbi:MAG: aminotransferase class V-fold PLP-dependent enzyme [Lysobacterales bacterium]